MRVLPETAAAEYDYRGVVYYFCAQRCMDRFRADPDAFLKSETQTAKAPAPGAEAIYTCPMHPEIRQHGPGACPKCGMSLEPELAAAGEGADPELNDMTRRFWMAAAMSVPVVALGMLELLPTLQLAIATP